jgi:hypothetical protein
MLMAPWFLGAALVAAQGAAAPTDGETISKEQAEARLANCGSRRFESVAEFQVDGKMKRSRLRLCAPDSASAAEWIATLEKNEASTKAQTGIPESARFKLLTDLRTEIDRLKSGQRLVPITGDPGIAAQSTTVAGKPDDFAINALPPLPPLAPPKAPVVEKSNDFAVTALPPLPTPKKAASTRFGSAPAGPQTIRPQLSIRCIATGGAAARCERLGKDGAFEIGAEEDLASSITLRFRRLDSGREGEVRLAQLKRGDSVRMNVPAAICKGVVLAEFDIQVSGAGSGGKRYSDVQGPFKKRC